MRDNNRRSNQEGKIEGGGLVDQGKDFDFGELLEIFEPRNDIHLDLLTDLLQLLCRQWN